MSTLFAPEELMERAHSPLSPVAPSVDIIEKPPCCTGCGRESPRTNTNYTLISSQHGWRLSFQTSSTGYRTSVWRCPECWKAYKGRG